MRIFQNCKTDKLSWETSGIGLMECGTLKLWILVVTGLLSVSRLSISRSMQVTTVFGLTSPLDSVR